MKYYFLLFISVVLLSCNGSHSDNNTATIKTQPSAPKYTTEQQQKVFGDIHFGITKKQYKQLYNKFLKSKKCEFGCKFANFYYDSAIPAYDHNALYYVQFSHSIGKYNNYEADVPKVVNDAYQAIKIEYGEPSAMKPIPNWPDVEKFNSYLINQWFIGDKVISIVVEQIDESYDVSLIIFKKSINDRVDREKEKAESLSNDSIMKSNKGTL